MQNRTFIEDLKYQFHQGGMTIQLIFINVFVFVVIQLISVLVYLTKVDDTSFFFHLNDLLFSLNTNLRGFIQAPWGIITSIFAHYGPMHLIFNMVVLYFTGKIFEQFFSRERLLYTYILGGIAGGILEIIIRAIFPVFADSSIAIIGASGSNMAIFMAIAFYRPNLEVNLFGIFPVKLLYLAAALILIDLIGIRSNDNIAHFAHLGGAILGIFSIRNINKQNNSITLFQRVMKSIFSFFKNLFRKKEVKFKVQQGGSARGGFKTDEEYNYEKKQKQIIIDQILDKISKSGYESLSKTEKEMLFDQSKNDK